MVQVMERTEGHYDLREVEFGEVEGYPPVRVILECDCRARMILDGYVSARRPLSEPGALECGVCGEKFILTRMVKYTWLEDYLERLESKEARHEYYARL